MADAQKPFLNRLEPVAVAKPWSGGHLDTLTEITGTGEMVLASAIDAFKVQVEHNGQKLLFADFWSQIRDSLGYGGDFPLLIKLLSTGAPMSVQVHPSDDDMKRLFNGGSGKKEAWCFLASEESAEVYLGLRETVPVTDFLNTCRSGGDVTELLYPVSPRPGQVYILNPGTVHSSRGRHLFFEIQQPSDATFRIYDFSHGRELHLDEAAEVIRPGAYSIPSDWSEDISEKEFQLSTARAKEYTVTRPFEIITYLGPPAVLISGSVKFPLNWADTFFSSAGASFSVSFTNESASSDLPLMNENEARLFISSAEAR